MQAQDGNTIADKGAQPLPPQPVIPRPFNNNVIVRQDEASDKIGSIFVPGTSQERPMSGVVVKVGPGTHDLHSTQLVPMQSKEGDKVFFSRYSGTELYIKGGVYKLIPETDLTCRMPREGEEGYAEYLASQEDAPAVAPTPKISPIAAAIMAPTVVKEQHPARATKGKKG